MEQTNLPQIVTNLPISLLLKNDKLSQTLQAQDPDFVSQVFIPYSKGMGIEKAVESKSPTFHDVSNKFGELSTLFWLRFHIAETFAFLGIYERVSVYQIRQTAELVINHEIYGQITLSEFLVFLRRFKQGRYGKIFNTNRPNPQEFLMCMELFWNELCHERGRAEERERVERISLEKRDFKQPSPEDQEAIRIIQEKLKVRFPSSRQHV